MSTKLQGPVKTVFAVNLRRLRLASPFKQKELARMLNTSPRIWRRWEDPEDTHWPNAHLFPILARILKCSINDFYSFELDGVPHTHNERELLAAVRQVRQGMPVTQITNALLLVLDKLNPEERKAWLKMGELLSKK